ncbi:hypothetical protein Q8A67_018886 [Cirrhinus molitorella]|uniref:Secreted protein n=1 Tax=Cirrhinus molitorella TaxID=172907 RepID=A0AA88PFB1_9TELE|nr:hypothetical protein Q8A67_018886 [Cirrhinus molitorella]
MLDLWCFVLFYVLSSSGLHLQYIREPELSVVGLGPLRALMSVDSDCGEGSWIGLARLDLPVKLPYSQTSGSPICGVA